jgi:hypothetical protein
MDKILSNAEKMKEYELLNFKINVHCSRVKELKEILKNGEFLDAEKEKEYKKEQTEFEDIIYTLGKDLIVMGIPVPQKEGYEIKKGLLEMKRDINLKLVFYLSDDDNKIRQVIIIIIF